MVSRPAIRHLQTVTCDLENQGSILSAIGDASIVICSIGASEKEVFDVTGPYRIDYKATKNLIEAGKPNIAYYVFNVIMWYSNMTCIQPILGH